MRSLSLFLLVACGTPMVDTDPAAILVKDDRLDWPALSATQKSRARASAVLIPKDNIRKNGAQYSLHNVETYQAWGDLCDDVRFADQPSAGHCSAFLIGPDLVMTAGHCVAPEEKQPEPGQRPCDDWRVVFDYQVRADGTMSDDYKDVYRCTRVVAHGGETDYAVMRLDREVVGRTPYVPARARPAVDDPVEMYSYPHGLPLKMSPGSVTESETAGDGFFEAHLDVFGGSSGAAVLDATSGALVGILVVGFGEFEDYEVARNGARCRRPRVFAADDVTAPWVLHIDSTTIPNGSAEQ